MQRPIILAQDPDISDIQPGINRAHIVHALLAYPTWLFREDQIGDGFIVLVYGYSGLPAPGTRPTLHPAGKLLRIGCLEREVGTLVFSARAASLQEENEYGISKEDL